MDRKINSSFICEEELERARRICASYAEVQRPLSKSCPTYVHFVAHLHSHYAAVQLKLTPFKPSEFREQTLFHPYYQYSQCCQKIAPDFQPHIGTVVQTILSAFYQIGPWNLSDQTW